MKVIDKFSCAVSDPMVDAEPTVSSSAAEDTFNVHLPTELWDRVMELSDHRSVATMFKVRRAFRESLTTGQLRERLLAVDKKQTCPVLPKEVLVERLVSVFEGADRLARLTDSGPFTIDTEPGELYSIWICPNSRFVVAEFVYPHIVRIYDLAQPQGGSTLLPEFKQGLTTVDMSFDGRTALIADYGRHNEVWNFSGATAELLGSIPGDINVASSAFSPDGALLLVGHSDGASLWDLRQRPFVGVDLPGPASWIYSAVFSPDGGRAVTCGGEGSSKATPALRLWDVEHKPPRLLHSFPCAASVAAAWFSADGLTLLTLLRESHAATVWDLQQDPPAAIDASDHAEWIRDRTAATWARGAAATWPRDSCVSTDGGFLLAADPLRRAALFERTS